MNLSNSENNSYISLEKRVAEASRKQTEIPLLKIQRMQNLYLEGKLDLYTNDRIALLKNYLPSLQYKFCLLSFHLEQLWSLSMNSRTKLHELIENCITRLEWQDDEKIVASARLESLLFQSKAFLDFWMVYTCLLFNCVEVGKINTGKFQKALDKIPKDSNFKPKSVATAEYYKTEVFGPGKWGSLVTGIRDKICHRDKIKPGDHGWEEIAKVLLDWPTIRNLSFDRFGQLVQNGAFDLITSQTPIMFELDWKSGPYSDDLWT